MDVCVCVCVCFFLQNNPDVEFEVPHAHVTATKTFRHACHGRPDSYALALGATRVIRVSPYASHAQYQVHTALVYEICGFQGVL